MEPLLTISDLSVTFATERGRVQALDGVSLELAAGETLAIVGESGSGKSVTALSILGLLGDAGQVKGGSIEFQGEDLTRVSAARLREIRGNQIAFIFQEPMSSLNPDKSGLPPHASSTDEASFKFSIRWGIRSLKAA